MNTKIKTSQVVKESSNAAVDTITKATIIGMAIVSGMVGIWAAVSMVSAVVSSGPGAVIRGFITAVTGV